LKTVLHVVACTHVGRPDGHVVEKYSVEPIARRLAELTPDVELLENLRFSPGEEGNDDDGLVRPLVAGMDLYVNEAFGASHRAHGSIVGPPTYLPSAAGLEPGPMEASTPLGSSNRRSVPSSRLSVVRRWPTSCR
jgi:3-phosphoglycerate kinase